jgi:antitoxin component YwqK of YwqJK toxin-antitoxin module
MDRAPARPTGVPEQAQWDPDADRWEVVARDGSGAKQGEAQLFRRDGSLFMRVRYEAGKKAGPFAQYHPSGAVAREGVFVADDIVGEVTAYASEEDEAEPLRGCCVPPGAATMRARYDAGRLMREIFFDGEGRALLSDGTPMPPRPPEVPAEASFDEGSRRWSTGPLDPRGEASGLWRWWSEQGRLVEEGAYQAGRRVLTRHHVDGVVVEEISLEGDGVRHGPYLRRYAAGESPYQDARVREERGSYEHGQPVGRWTFHDADGAELRVVDRGRAWTDGEQTSSEVFSPAGREPSAWRELARRLRDDGRVREAIVAAARATARDRDAAALRGFLEPMVFTLRPDAGRALLDAAVEQSAMAPVFDAMLAGAELAAGLKLLSSSTRGSDRAALDLVDAALILAPDELMFHATRALVRLELGDREGARADAVKVAEVSPDTAAFLSTYIRLLFPVFDFWPSREIPFAEMEGLPEQPEQSLEHVRRVIQVYVTRLARLRGALLARVDGAPAWLPPDLSALLPDGPLDLRRHTVTIVDQTDEGTEESQVEIDETLTLEQASVPALMREARSAWAALTWLCWTAGLDEVGLPTELAPPANFAQGAGMAITRCWRAQDAVLTGGLRAMTAGVPGFDWEGLPIDGLSKVFAEIAAAEYLELRSVMLFLVSPENVSPFQEDIRKA